MTQYVCLFFFAVVVLSFFFAVWMGTGIFDLIRLLSIYASSSLDDGFNLLCALLGFRLLGYFRRCAAGCAALLIIIYFSSFYFFSSSSDDDDADPRYKDLLSFIL
jgi:hypothetical protein